MSFEWYARYHQKALDGMLMLTLEERGAYNTLLDLIYSRGAAIPDDARWLAGWMGCPVRRWNQLRAALIVKGKIYAVVVNALPCLMNAKAAAEIAAADLRRDKLAVSGASGGRRAAELRAAAKENNDLALAPLVGSLKLIDTTETVEKKVEANASLSSADDAALSRTYPELFETAWRAYPHIRGRSSKRKALAVWRRIPAPVRDRLPEAVNRYAREGREPKQECGAPAMDRWLFDERFGDWLEPELPVEPATPSVIAWRNQHFRETGEWRNDWGQRQTG